MEFNTGIKLQVVAAPLFIFLFLLYLNFMAPQKPGNEMLVGKNL